MGSFAINGNQGKAILATEKNWQHCQEFKNYKFYKDSINFFNYVLHYITLYDKVILKKGENKMLKLQRNITNTFEANDEFMIDIIDTLDTFEAWIYKKNMGVKDLMFGVERKEQEMDEFIDTVIKNLPEYEEAYIEQWERR